MESDILAWLEATHSPEGEGQRRKLSLFSCRSFTLYASGGFHEERPLFQDDNTPIHMARCVQIWLDEHNDEGEHFTWCPQLPDRQNH